MTTFDERERAFEQKFVHDEEMRFRALARRNKLAALWAVQQLALQPKDADLYVRESVDLVLAEDGEVRFLRKITADLGGLSSYWTESRLHGVMAEFMAKAAAEVQMEPT